jgi:hypothetical protein
MSRALVLALLAAALAAAASSASTPRRSYAFGRHGGNIAPWTATISATGKVGVAGAARRTRTVVPRLGMTNLAKRFDLDRFFALPAKIRCRKQLPDVATFWVTARRGGVVHTVDGQLGCRARFDSAFGTLRNISRVKS